MRAGYDNEANHCLCRKGLSFGRLHDRDVAWMGGRVV